MSGKLIAGLLVGLGLISGAAMYWLQVYAFYEDLALAMNGGEVVIRATNVNGGLEDLEVTEFRGIDASSSPIRFRACFETDVDPETLSPYPEAVPLVAPNWFGCFDAVAIGEALESGAAKAYLGEQNVTFGIDRIIALFPDGMGYSWHQINACGEVAFDGGPLPPGCPPAPERLN